MDTNSFISWNVRGACSFLSRQHISNLIRLIRPSLVCLQETKCSKWSTKSVAQLGMGNNIEWIESPARGLSGGLITVWSKDYISISVSSFSQNWIMVRGINISNNIPFVCINVYAPQSATAKQLLWDNLSSMLLPFKDTHVCLLGDFNAVRHKSEKSACLFNMRVSSSFNEFFTATSLLEIPLSNSSFTWFGPNKWKGRLDRVLVSPAWFGKGGWTLTSYHRKFSDHKPIVLKTDLCEWGPKPFKFYNCWLQDPILAQSLKSCWSGMSSNNPQIKFKALRGEARAWNKVKLGNIDIKIQKLEQQQEDYDSNVNSRNDIQVIRDELLRLHQFRSSMLCRQSKTNWLLHGERNTKFFHSAIAKRRAFNSVKKLVVEGNVISRPAGIKIAFLEHFHKRMTVSTPAKIFELGDIFLPKLSSDQCASLEKDFTLQEIEEALKMTEKTKAPGPDGINAGVIELLWLVMKDEVLNVFRQFHSTCVLPPGSNSSFIALIPKITNVTQPSDFRPISLMNALVKLLSKVLANRLKLVMTILVSQHQSAFIKGRQISDGILITSEIISLLQNRKTRGLVFKIDFEKAFDRVNWDFVFDIFNAMNFGSKWIGWVRSIFTSSRISILVNGSPTQEFTPSRGLRQGDPLSPLIFNLVGEALSCLLTMGVSKGIFRGIESKGDIKNFTHLQFADDVILFINDDDSSVLGVKRTLQCFQVISGMKLNFEKSKIFGFHASTSQLRKWTSYLCCMHGKLPFTYLGASIGSSPTAIKFWDPLISRIKKKLGAYETSHISMVGRVILLKAAIDSTPIYWLTLLNFQLRY